MYSDQESRFNPLGIFRKQSALYDGSNLTSEESDYYSSSYVSSSKRNTEPLRFIIIRHGERIDVTYGAGWTRYAFNQHGQYFPFAPNMPAALPYRENCFDYDVDTPLTANGLKQAWNVGDALAKYSLPVTACYSSPAFRSLQTADCILQGMGRKGKHEQVYCLFSNR